MHHVGIDLGGTKVEVALTGASFDAPLLRQREPTEQGGATALVAQLGRLFHRARALVDGPVTLGLGLPGSIEPDTNAVRNCVLPWLDGTPLPAMLQEVCGIVPAIINDAQAFALSEARLGAGRGSRMVLGLTLGTGIGGGLVLDGLPWSGRHGIAGEWGHICVEPQGRRCYCGRTGCAEQYLSGKALEQRYRELGGIPRPLAMIAARRGDDPLADQVLLEAVEWFGRTLGGLVNLLDPDVIVLGGGVSHLPLLFTQGREAVAMQAMTRQFTTPILPAALGDSSGVLGAALVGAV